MASLLSDIAQNGKNCDNPFATLEEDIHVEKTEDNENRTGQLLATNSLRNYCPEYNALFGQLRCN